MNRAQFLKRLASALRGAPKSEVAKSLAYYSEILDDRAEEGLSEDEAVRSLGDVDAIAGQILFELPPGSIRPRPRAITVVLLILGFPLWASVLAAIAAAVLSVYIAVWSVALALWCAEVAVGVASGATIVGAVNWLLSGDVPRALISLGAALALAGITIFGICGMVPLTKLLGSLSARAFRWIARRIAEKRGRTV